MKSVIRYAKVMASTALGIAVSMACQHFGLAKLPSTLLGIGIALIAIYAIHWLVGLRLNGR